MSSLGTLSSPLLSASVSPRASKVCPSRIPTVTFVLRDLVSSVLKATTEILPCGVQALWSLTSSPGTALFVPFLTATTARA